MELDIFSQGKEYISASRAAKKTGYASDYIGQLCRRGKIPGKLVGRTWYVELESLLTHKRTRQLGKPRRIVEPEAFKVERPPAPLVLKIQEQPVEIFPITPVPEVKIESVLDEAPLVPILVKRVPVARAQNVSRFVPTKHYLVVALSMVLVIGGAATLLRSPESLAMKGERLETQALGAEVAAVSFFDGLSSSAEFLINGFRRLQEVAFGGSPSPATPPAEEPVNRIPASFASLPAESPASQAITQATELAPFNPLSLKAELEAYVRTQISSLAAPEARVVYQSFSPVINTTVLREDILTADTRPTVTRQSTSDIDHTSNVITRLMNEGSFANSTLTNATVSGPVGQFNSFSFGLATGTAATTTNFYTDNATIASLWGTDVNLTNLLFTNATGTYATTTNLFATTASSTNLFSTSASFGAATTSSTFAITGNGSGLTFSGTGNHDISASSGTLRIGSNTIIGNIEALDSTIDIGTPSVRFDKIYADEVNASTIVGTLTGGNLTAETFSINSDNATADTEDSFLAFERGSVTPNALLRWNSTADQFEFNNSLLISGNSTTTNATTTSLFSTTASSTNLFSSLASFGGTQGLNVIAGGSVGIGTTNPLKTLDVQAASASAQIKSTTIGNSAYMVFTANAGSNFYVGRENTSGGGLVSGDTASAAVLSNEGTAPMQFANNGSVVMTILNGGNVGIGTTNPDMRLHIYAPTGDAETNIQSIAANSTALLQLKNDAQIWQVRVDGDDSDKFKIRDSTVGAYRLTIDSSGNVGIGTTNPAAKLDLRDGEFSFTDADVAHGMTVLNSTETFGNFSITDSTAGGLKMRGFADTGAIVPMTIQGVLGSNDPTDSVPAIQLTGFKSNGGTSITSVGTLETVLNVVNFTTPLLTVLGGGNVGIGTTNPGAKLEVNGGSAGSFVRLVGATGFDSALNFYESSTVTFGIGQSPSGDRTSLQNYVASDALSITTNFGKFSVNTANGSGVDALTILSNTNVGIGTTNPGQKVTISGSQSGGANNSTTGALFSVISPTDGIFMRNREGTVGIGGQGFAGQLFASSGMGDFEIYNAAASYSLVLGTAATERMRITSSGNVGIGTTAPNSKLEVAAANVVTSGFQNLFVRTTDALGADLGGGIGFGGIYTGTTVTQWAGISGRKENATDGNTSGYLTLNTRTNGDATAERVRITSSGNVGIGTTNPGGILDLYSGTNPTSYVTNSGTGLARGIYRNTTTSLQVGQENASGGSLISGASPSLANAAVINQTGAYALQFGTNNIGRMIIDSSGNVGIGTTNPSYPLHVKGSTVVQQALESSSSDATVQFITNSNSSQTWGVGVAGSANGISVSSGSMYFGSPSTAHLTISTSGNVGIGTNPSTRLHVTGNGRFEDTSGQVNLYINGGGSANYNGIIWQTSSAEKWFLGRDGTNSADNFILRTGSAVDVLRVINSGAVANTLVLNTGNVGIGTTTPQAKLTVSEGNTRVDCVSSTCGFEITSSNAVRWRMLNRADVSNRFELRDLSENPVFVLEQGAPANQLLLDSSGDFGIASSTPFAKLSVENTGSGLSFAVNDVANDSSPFVIDATGNVGIGTTNPGKKLDVLAGNTDGIRVRSSSVNEANVSLILSNTGTGGLDWNIVSSGAGHDDGNGKLFFGVAFGTPKMVIDGTSGNVGIGTTSPWTTLAVAGRVALPNLSNNGTGYYACVNAAGGGAELATSTTACGASSIKYKENVEDLNYGLSEVLSMRPVSFDWKEDFMPQGTHQVGFIAEEMETLIPEIIGYDSNGEVMNMDYAKLTSVITNAIKEIATITGIFRDNLIAWMGDAANGIEKFFAKEVHAEKLCLKKSDGSEICLDGDQVSAIATSAGGSYTITSSPVDPGNGGDDTASSTMGTLEIVSEDTSTSTPEVLTPSDSTGQDETASSTEEILI